MVQVVTANVPFSGGIIALNNFGAGGTNAHLLVQGEHVEWPAGCNRNGEANGNPTSRAHAVLTAHYRR